MKLCLIDSNLQKNESEYLLTDQIHVDRVIFNVDGI